MRASVGLTDLVTAGSPTLCLDGFSVGWEGGTEVLGGASGGGSRVGGSCGVPVTTSSGAAVVGRVSGSPIMTSRTMPIVSSTNLVIICFIQNAPCAGRALCPAHMLLLVQPLARPR